LGSTLAYIPNQKRPTSSLEKLVHIFYCEISARSRDNPEGMQLQLTRQISCTTRAPELLFGSQPERCQTMSFPVAFVRIFISEISGNDSEER
jgi:hypothetical protein